VGDPVRILLVEMPQLLREILAQAIQGRSECELLKGSARGLRSLTEQTASPDVVILGLTAAEDTTLVPALLTRWPGAQVMTLMPAGQDVTAYELTPHERELGKLSPGEIVDSLCEAISRKRALTQDLTED
jgi:DNA-binding NarL/FixJ family response regulator